MSSSLNHLLLNVNAFVNLNDIKTENTPIIKGENFCVGEDVVFTSQYGNHKEVKIIQIYNDNKVLVEFSSGSYDTVSIATLSKSLSCVNDSCER